MTANINATTAGAANRQWRSNANKSGATQEGGAIQLRAPRPNELPDHDPRETDAMIKAKLKTRFEVLQGMVQDVVTGDVRALIASGPGGVGKTETVDRVFSAWDPEGTAHTVSKGYVKATGLYKLLYQHRAKTDKLVFDDADSIWFDETALNFLKVATDTLRKNKPRTLTYGAEFNMVDDEGQPIPRRFDFEGSLIFLTNLDFDAQIDKGTKLAPHMEAMMTRCHYIDLGMRTKRDYLVRIYQVADEGLFDDFDMTREQENEVLGFIAENLSFLREISLRMALKIAGLRMGKSAAGDWKKIARITCCRGLA